ncbi:hypothetical protein BXZ70DRAFT_1001723 [Cristinia sonorae]|uniref:WD40 repeat-like protein n=1 Tax=Cristinia sonorae TaxID=1940300 RepID=A0A8K0UKI4_9AGAR|nr:hypothetical protein BXZ70DRAFT_1001723 [Cristinia sonorae]
MHLMPANPVAPTTPPGLLVASLQYGVVARCYPVTGKVLHGYFDAAGILNGLGVGNPNAEFSPDVSKCTMSVDGGTAKIIWGLRNGAVAVTTAARAMDAGRISGRWAKCSAADQHIGSVEDAVWVGRSSYLCVTGGADGTVKLWEGKRMTCLWTSGEPKSRDPCVKVAINLAYGIIASVMHSGQIFLWSGFKQVFGAEDPANEALTAHETNVAVSPSANTAPAHTEGQDAPPAREVTSFHLHCPSESIVSFISVYNNDTHIYRTTINLRTGDVDRISYGHDSGGSISAVEPIFGPSNSSFIVVGDQLGYVAIYPWTDVCPTKPVAPLRKFEAHTNGAVTAIKWTPTVLVTGSSLGSTEVWDSIGFSHLRSFPSVGLRATERVWDPVSRIVVERDLVIVSVGSRVMTWLGGPVGEYVRKGKHLKMSAKASNSVAKWQRQVELYKDIADSRREIEHEGAYTQRAYGREREQMSQLDTLGLSEVEAIEYVLMLSRDEEEARRRSSAREDEGVFMADFDETQTLISAKTPFALGSSHPTSSRSSLNGDSRSHPRAVPSASNSKVQISPRFRPEPMEAGMSISPISRENSFGSVSSSVRSSASTGDATHFPSMSSTPTNSTGTRTPTRRSASGGTPESVRSAWSIPFCASKSERPSPPSSSSAASPSFKSGPSSPTRQRGLLRGGAMTSKGLVEGTGSSPPSNTTRGGMMTREEREAEDLRFAIELSLAEARSRGENI